MHQVPSFAFCSRGTATAVAALRRGSSWPTACLQTLRCACRSRTRYRLGLSFFSCFVFHSVPQHQVELGTAESSNAAAEANNLAARISSETADAISFTAELGEELPFLDTVLKSLRIIRKTTETMNSYREELRALRERCTYVTACVIVKCRRTPASGVDPTLLEDCVDSVEAVGFFAERCNRRSKLARVVTASRDKSEIARLNARIDSLTVVLGLASTANLEGKVDDIKVMPKSFCRLKPFCFSHAGHPALEICG